MGISSCYTMKTVLVMSAMIALCLAASMMPGELSDRNAQNQPQELGDNEQYGMGGKGMGGKGMGGPMSMMMGGKGNGNVGDSLGDASMQQASNRVDQLNQNEANMMDKVLQSMSPEDRRKAMHDELFQMERSHLQQEINDQKTEGMSNAQREQFMEQRLANNLGWDDSAASNDEPDMQ